MTTGTSLNSKEWKPYDTRQEPDKNATHIFKIEIDNYYHNLPPGYTTILSGEELTKADRFIHKHDADRFTVTRHALRSILSKFVFIDPASILFHRSGNKKPATNGIEFNISHSQDILLVAVSPLAVGIDVEFIQSDFDFSALKKACFNIEEQTYIHSSPAFYELWTRKEAVLKATGEGLVDDMKKVGCLGENIVRKNINLTIQTFLPEQQYMASLATMAQREQTYFWHFY